MREDYTRNDLSYGDSLWGSRRINRALSGLYNEYVFGSAFAHKQVL
jgi:hypothetical protein